MALLLLPVFFLRLTSADTSARDVNRAPVARQANEPIRVIFDTDIWSDIDDMLALAMLHALQDRHEVNLVAVTISTGDPWCASYVDLVNTFYGHPQIPVGIVRSGVNFPKGQKSYPDVISQRRTSTGALLYPHRLVDGRTAPAAVSLLRKTLAAQPDGSVVVIQVGFSTNLALLLDSKADSVSPDNGRDLVARKVRLLSVMAGNFRDSEFEGKTFPKGAPETNLLVDVTAAQNVFSRWPTPIVDSGFEIGLAMLYPGQSVPHDYAYVENHPIADSYRTFCNEQKAQNPKIRRCPEDHNRATFDLTAVLYAARPDRNYFSLSNPGKIVVLPDGGSRFDETSEGQHRHLILNDAQRARTLEAMVMLASQPPAHFARP
jgi:inosine-uridine nucleoside N-ribohydrolase